MNIRKVVEAHPQQTDKNNMEELNKNLEKLILTDRNKTNIKKET